jgi:hypothetical protein
MLGYAECPALKAKAGQLVCNRWAQLGHDKRSYKTLANEENLTFEYRKIRRRPRPVFLVIPFEFERNYGQAK